jgi:hypothetical protein
VGVVSFEVELKHRIEFDNKRGSHHNDGVGKANERLRIRISLPVTQEDHLELWSDVVNYSSPIEIHITLNAFGFSHFSECIFADVMCSVYSVERLEEVTKLGVFGSVNRYL